VQLVECVPNFSEGRDPIVITAITSAIEGVDGVTLLDVDPGATTNRMVVTFVGPPEPVAAAAFAAIAKAAELIDMSRHHGEHPRMGATDVCPFVPVTGITMQECADLARRLAQRVGSELGIPVYLYEHAAPDGRRSLSTVRHGEYEGLADRPDPPDFGPRYNPRAGATAIGARQFLIAYNVNLNTRDRKLAHQIAQAIRSLGAPRRDSAGKPIKDDAGNTGFIPGRFKECKAVGWYIDEYDRAQVSINLTDYHVTGVHDVFNACREEAVTRGMRVTGSEIVGLVPRSALLAAGAHFLRAQGKTTAVPEPDLVHAAVLSLGLDELAPFTPETKVVEYRCRIGTGHLAELAVRGFADELSTDSPAPGGGSAAALAGSLSAALSSMVAALTFTGQGTDADTLEMEQLGQHSQDLKDWFIAAIDRDADAFNAVLAARRMPRKTDAECVARDRAIPAAYRKATLVPLEVLEHAVEALELAVTAARQGNRNSVSDAGVAGACARAAAEGASLNVQINLSSLEGPTDDIVSRHDAARDRARELAATVHSLVDAAITR